MRQTFAALAQQLEEVNTLWSQFEITPLRYRREHERLIVSALYALALEHGVIIQPGLAINDQGDIRITSKPPSVSQSRMGVGPFGESFSALLNPYHPRSTAAPGASLTAVSGWCDLHHVAIEKMVLTEYAKKKVKLDATDPHDISTLKTRP